MLDRKAIILRIHVESIWNQAEADHIWTMNTFRKWKSKNEDKDKMIETQHGGRMPSFNIIGTHQF